MVLVRIANKVPAAMFGPNGIIRSMPTSIASKRMMLIIAAKIKLKNTPMNVCKHIDQIVT